MLVSSRNQIAAVIPSLPAAGAMRISMEAGFANSNFGLCMGRVRRDLKTFARLKILRCPSALTAPLLEQPA
jgi:hypothetical protein